MTEPTSATPDRHRPESPILESFPRSRWVGRVLCVWLAAVLGGFLWLRVLGSATVQRLLSQGP